MPDFTTAREHEGNSRPDWLISLFLMLIILVANTVLIIGLLQVLTWTECLLIVLAGIGLSGGILYTVVTMERLGKRG